MKKYYVLTVLALLLAFIPQSAFASSANAIIDDAIEIVKSMTTKSDAADMASVLKDCHAVAIVPSMAKAGFLLGGQYGEGLIFKRENGKWYGPSFYNIGGASFGPQIGAQSISLLLVVTNEKGVRAFLNSKTKLGADVSVVAGPSGRRGEAATDAQARASIYSYSMTKGLFAGFSLEGSVISISVKHNEEFWGKKTSADDALNRPATNKRVKPLIDALEALRKKAN